MLSTPLVAIVLGIQVGVAIFYLGRAAVVVAVLSALLAADAWAWARGAWKRRRNDQIVNYWESR